jgi:hypothetical protein
MCPTSTRAARARGGERDGLRVVRVELHGDPVAELAGDLREAAERALRRPRAAQGLADRRAVGVAPRRLGAQGRHPRPLRRQVAGRLGPPAGGELPV